MSLRLGLRDDERDRVADMPHRVRREHGIDRRRHLLPVEAGQRREARERAERLDVRAGQDQFHTLFRACGRRVDLHDFGLGMRRAQDHAGQRVLWHDVRAVLPGARHEFLILDTTDRLTDPEFHGRHWVFFPI